MQQRSPDSHSLDAADLNSCRTLLSCGSRTFYAASFLLPRRVREPATALYAFCRLADDAIDLGDGSPAVLDDLYARLDATYAGTPSPIAADRVFADTVRHHDIPQELPEALIEGFKWDAENRRYETLADLEGYAARVAGTVGTMMALLMGVRDQELLARACDLGIAMQLTNIARDVGEDAQAGRLYLPRDWMREAGIDCEEWLARPQFSAALASVIARLLEAAEELYRRSESGIAGLPADCRPGIYAARFLYAGIGHQVARNGFDSVSQRATLPRNRKLALLLPITAASARSLVRIPKAEKFTVVEAARFLISAAGRSSPDAVSTEIMKPEVPWWDIYGGIVNAIEIFERLGRLEREQRGSPSMPMQSMGAPGT